MNYTAAGRWAALDAKRTGLITRCERYAELTLPHVCPKDGYDEGSQEASGDYQSVGAQATNNLVNKMMLAMFAPSRPFMRFELNPIQKGIILDALGVSEAEFREESSVAEKDAIKLLDSLAIRPKLFDLFQHLIITGNCVRYMDGDATRILGIKDYVVRRNNKGEMVELLIREKTAVEDLPEEVQQFAGKRNPDDDVWYYRWWRKRGKLYHETQYIEDTLIAHKKYVGRYLPKDMPVQAHTWNLPDKRNYGVGHVEHSIGDLEAMSMLSEAELNGAILASEFRWLINPGGQTNVSDFKVTANGDALPGVSGDMELVSAGPVAAAVQMVGSINEKYVRRIGAAFLLTAGVQRDAERVTAEEIRLLANELETGLGGIYSRLAVDLQLPLAYWLMNKTGGGIFKDTDFEPVIVTGLDALSRNGDLENTQLFIQDVIQITSMPPEVLAYLKVDAIFSDLAAGRGLRGSQYVRSEAEVQQQQQKAQQKLQEQQTDMMAQEAALKGNK
ncbi:head-tail connector [Pectobacterium phage MA13]|uniref:Head-tail connector n=1 Tax=Pectobacterium phage MA13 TaxID=2662284 RepID=A0A5Q2F7V3_9CAUD|nr:head-tail connector [Pectobacterium phage MA13]